MAAWAQAPAPKVPAELQPSFDVLKGSYPKVEARRMPKTPADTVWMFRAETYASGTVEVGFQKDEVVYMIFRRGTGGTSWKLPEIHALHVQYHRDLLKEEYDSTRNYFSKYNHSLAPQINGALITLKSFDAKKVQSGN